MINNSNGNRAWGHSAWAEVVSPIESIIEYYLIQRAIDLIDTLEQENKPFFFAPTQFLDLYRDMKIPESPSFREDAASILKIYERIRRPEQGWSFFENTLRHYYACISHIDAQIGRLIEHPKVKGYTQDAFASTCDIYVTILGLAGYVPQDAYGFDDGKSTRFIENKSKEGWANDIVTEDIGAFDFQVDTYKMNNLLDKEDKQECILNIKNKL